MAGRFMTGSCRILLSASSHWASPVLASASLGRLTIGNVLFRRLLGWAYCLGAIVLYSRFSLRLCRLRQ